MDDQVVVVDYDDNGMPLSKGVKLTATSVMKAATAVSGGGGGGSGANTQGAARYIEPKTVALSKLNSKIDLDRVSGTVKTSVRVAEGAIDKNRIRTKEKADRATTEQVLDPRTRMILFKMLNRELLTEIHGCVSTGKEANVYHAISKAYGEVAVKVYKTSILVFKDRDRYVTGEHRFRHGYCKSNPRKMVKLWAEKEMRNLKRLETAGIPCPKPLALRMHVLLMSFIGKDGWGAPRLKDAELSDVRLRECYVQCVKLMRIMFQVCKLVHADLSEYNILYFNKSLYFIDVSQSVEHEHPQAFEFLKMDCTNITRYFQSQVSMS